MKIITKFYIIFIIIFSLFLYSCTKVRESAGVTRKSIDEFQSVENAPLVIPPDFNLVSPDKIDQKNIDDIDQELAEEILFGLDEDSKLINQNSTAMSKILKESNALNISDEIREEINNEFANEKKTDSVFQVNWENEEEVLDAVKESQRIRNKNFEGKSISDGDVPIKIEKVKVKKKKRFWIF